MVENIVAVGKIVECRIRGTKRLLSDATIIAFKNPAPLHRAKSPPSGNLSAIAVASTPASEIAAADIPDNAVAYRDPVAYPAIRNPVPGAVKEGQVLNYDVADAVPPNHVGIDPKLQAGHRGGGVADGIHMHLPNGCVEKPFALRRQGGIRLPWQIDHRSDRPIRISPPCHEAHVVRIFDRQAIRSPYRLKHGIARPNVSAGIRPVAGR